MVVKDTLRAYPVIGTSDKMQFRVIEFPGSINNSQDVAAPCSYMIPTWSQMEELAFRLAKEIRRSHQIDAVVGAANGGLPYATLLRDRFDRGGKILTVGVTGYDKNNKALEGREVVYELPQDANFYGKTVVVADDINDAGKTEEALKALVALKNPKEVLGVSFFQRPYTKSASEYTGCVVEDPQHPWIVFPHDLYDSIKKIGGVWSGQGVSKDVIYRRFNQMFQTNLVKSLAPQIDDAMERFFP